MGKEGWMIRLLRAEEIECRAAAVKENGLSLLLYKDARVDQRILDETFGPFGWKRSHQCIDGNLYCTVEIRDSQSGEWVAKQDVGTTGYTEKEKTQASDSFKRACFNWGIGRELYSAPFIWITAAMANIQAREDPKTHEKHYYCNDRFSVFSISYNNDREINGLVIVNKNGQAVYDMKTKENTKTPGTAAGKGKKQEKAGGIKETDNAKTPAGKGKKQEKADGITAAQMKSLEAELQRTGVGMAAVKERYKFDQPEKMPEELYKKVMQALSRTRSAA